MKNYANRSGRATRTTRRTRAAASSPITCSGCGWSASRGCHCDYRTERRAGELLHAFLNAGDNLDKRRTAMAAMKEWRITDGISRLEYRAERRLIEGSKADKVRRMRGLTDGRIGGHLALYLHRRMFEPHLYGPESIDVLARRHRVPLVMLKAQRDRFIHRTAFAATAAPAPSGPDTRRLLQLGSTLLAVAQ